MPVRTRTATLFRENVEWSGVFKSSPIKRMRDLRKPSVWRSAASKTVPRRRVPGRHSLVLERDRDVAPQAQRLVVLGQFVTRYFVLYSTWTLLCVLALSRRSNPGKKVQSPLEPVNFDSRNDARRNGSRR
jgi:hypothetical protein